MSIPRLAGAQSKAPRGRSRPASSGRDAASSLWTPGGAGHALDALSELAASLAPGEDLEAALDRAECRRPCP